MLRLPIEKSKKTPSPGQMNLFNNGDKAKKLPKQRKKRKDVGVKHTRKTSVKSPAKQDWLTSWEKKYDK